MSASFHPNAYYTTVTASHIAPNIIEVEFTDTRLPDHEAFRLVLVDSLAQQVADALAAAGVVAQAVTT